MTDFAEPATQASQPGRAREAMARNGGGAPEQATDRPAELATVRFPYRVGARTLLVSARRLARVRYGVDELAGWSAARLDRCRIDAPLLVNSVPESELEALRAMHPRRILWVRQRFPHYWADLSGGMAALLERMSGKTRSTLKRKERKFADANGGRVDVRIYRSPEEIDAFFPLARAVSVKTYQDKLLGAGLPASDRFRAHARQLAADGKAFGFLLFHQQEPIAYLYCPVEQHTAVYAYVGHLDQFAELSPGTVLQMNALRLLAEAGSVHWYDFTPGKGQHKQIFSTGGIDCMEVVLLDASLGNRWLVASQKGFHGAMERSREMFERYGLAGRLRRLIRGQA